MAAAGQLARLPPPSARRIGQPSLRPTLSGADLFRRRHLVYFRQGERASPLCRCLQNAGCFRDNRFLGAHPTHDFLHDRLNPPSGLSVPPGHGQRAVAGLRRQAKMPERPACCVDLSFHADVDGQARRGLSIVAPKMAADDLPRRVKDWMSQGKLNLLFDHVHSR